MNQEATAIQQQVKEYHKQGWTAVSAEYGSKGNGLSKGYMDTTHDKVDFDWWRHKPKNVYMLLGSKSNNLADIDLDCPEACHLFPMFVDEYIFPKTGMFGRSGNITHAVFQTESSAITSKFCSPSGDVLVEIRGEGHGTIFPPSKHEGTGALIQWQSKSIEPHVISVKALKTKTGQLATACLIAQEWPRESGRRNELAMAVSSCFLRSEDLSVEFVQLLLQKIAFIAGDPEYRNRGDVVRRTADNLESGKGVTGIPKLSEILGQDVADKASEWLGLATTSKEAWGDPLINFTVSLGDFLAKDLPPEQYLIYPIIKRSSLNMVFGQRGVAKTWFTYLMAKAVADGADFLGYKNQSPPCNVLIIDGEMAENDMQSRLRCMGISNLENIMLLSSERLYLEDQPIHLHNVIQQERINELIDALEQSGRKPAMIILDNLSSMSGGVDENSNSDQEQLLQWLIGLRHRQISALLVHHAGKNGTQRGASRREDLLNTVIQLSPPPQTDEQETLPLDIDGPCFHVEFTKVRGPAPAAKELTVQLQLKEGIWTPNVKAVSNITMADKVLRVIFDDGPIPQKDIVKNLGVSKGTVSKAVTKLVENDIVQKPIRGKPLAFDSLGKDALIRAFPELAEEAEKQFPDII